MSKTKKFLVCVVLLCFIFASTADAILWFLAGVIRAGAVAVSAFVSTPIGQSVVRSAINHVMVLGGLAYWYFDRGSTVPPAERYIQVELTNTKAAVQNLNASGEIFPGVPPGGSAGFYLSSCTQKVIYSETGKCTAPSLPNPSPGSNSSKTSVSAPASPCGGFSVYQNMEYTWPILYQFSPYNIETSWAAAHYLNEGNSFPASQGWYVCGWAYGGYFPSMGQHKGTYSLCRGEIPVSCHWECAQQERDGQCSAVGSPTSGYNTGVACASPSPATTCASLVSEEDIDEAVGYIFTNDDLKKYMQDAIGKDMMAGGSLVSTPIAGEPITVIGSGGTSKEWASGTSEQEMSAWVNNSPSTGSSPSASASDIGSAVGTALGTPLNDLKASVNGVKASTDGVKASVDAINEKVGESPGSASVPSYDSDYTNPTENNISNRITSFVSSNPIIGAISGSHLSLSGAVCSASVGSAFEKPLTLDFCWMEQYLVMFGNVLVIFAGLTAAFIIFRRGD